MDASRFVDPQRLHAFCTKWRIQELLVFGSIARGEERPDSDLDLLVTFRPEARWTLLDHVGMEEELSALAGRQVHMVTKRAVERSSNELRRNMILADVEPFYAL